MEFDELNLPSRINPFGICEQNYVSIASYNRPNQNIKICGQRRSIKFITTYNLVLINFISTTNIDIEIGFRLTYKILRENCWLRLTLFYFYLLCVQHT